MVESLPVSYPELKQRLRRQLVALLSATFIMLGLGVIVQMRLSYQILQPQQDETFIVGLEIAAITIFILALCVAVCATLTLASLWAKFRLPPRLWQIFLLLAGSTAMSALSAVFVLFTTVAHLAQDNSSVSITLRAGCAFASMAMLCSGLAVVFTKVEGVWNRVTQRSSQG